MPIYPESQVLKSLSQENATVVHTWQQENPKLQVFLNYFPIFPASSFLFAPAPVPSQEGEEHYSGRCGAGSPSPLGHPRVPLTFLMLDLEAG